MLQPSHSLLLQMQSTTPAATATMQLLLLPLPPSPRLPLVFPLLPSPPLLLSLLLQVLYNRKHKRCLYPPCSPMRSLSHHSSSCPRAVSVYQQCADANASDTRVCNDILLDKTTVDCLAGSDTPLIVHYHRCLETACNLDNSAVDPMIRYIDDNNCGEDGKSEPLVVVLLLIFRVDWDHGLTGYWQNETNLSDVSDQILLVRRFLLLLPPPPPSPPPSPVSLRFLSLLQSWKLPL